MQGLYPDRVLTSGLIYAEVSRREEGSEMSLSNWRKQLGSEGNAVSENKPHSNNLWQPKRELRKQDQENDQQQQYDTERQGAVHHVEEAAFVADALRHEQIHSKWRGYLTDLTSQEYEVLAALMAKQDNK